jgi:hypothetical protein
MRAKASLLPGRRSRTSRFVRRVILVVFVVIVVFIGVLVFMLYHSFGNDADLFPPSITSNLEHKVVEDNWKTTLPTGAGDAGTASAAAMTHAPDAIPYSESLDELLELLRIYTTSRGIRVNQSALNAFGTLEDAAAAGAQLPMIPDELELAGVNELRRNSPAQADGNGLHTQWMLDDPAAIQDDQEAYVERYIAPVQSDAALTPLRVLSAYYNPQSPRSLHQLAAATEKSMNDDGYATFIQRSATFFDPSHAARRGYGAEGSIFVAVPFTLSDITPDMVDAIRTHAAASPSAMATEAAALRNPLDGADDAVGAHDVDGFREVQRTAAKCAATVESVFRHAHHSVSVTVGTVDVVVVSGIQSVAEADLATPAEVRRPITEGERANVSATRHRRYDRVTCEPPNFRSGWEDVMYGYSWKDNLRQRRVLVPLTSLEGVDPTAAATTTTTTAGATGHAASSSSSIELPNVGRYATLELYRGESYVFLLNPGAVVLPNWDLKLRLLYLRTPRHHRAVLSGRPTPAVVWQSLAAAMMRTWTRQPYLSFSLADGKPQSTAIPREHTEQGRVGADNAAAAGVMQVPPLDWTGRRLLSMLPQSTAAWLMEARGEATLALWLVTPRWLWPTLVDAVREWRAFSADKPATSSSTVKPALRDVLCEAALRDILGDGAAATAQLDLDSVVISAESSDEGTAQVHGAGDVTRKPHRITTTSLTEAEVYKLLLLVEKRAALPNEPITDMRLLTTSTTTMNESVVTTAAASGAAGDGAVRTAAVGAGMVLCGTAGTPLAYYAVPQDALVKRAFEYCWIMQHRAALRTLVDRLTRATSAATILQSGTTTAAAGAAGGGLATCGADERSSLRWYTTKVLPHTQTSRCLADMRYLDPSEPPLISDDAKPVAAQGPAEAAWFASPKEAGQLRGSGEVPPTRHSEAALSTMDTNGPTTTATAPPGAATTTATTTTPYVLQSVASAALLFGPAEAFFAVAPEDRLRTRAYSLADQLHRKQAQRNASAVPPSPYADTPEAVPLDPSLHYMDEDALDLYLTSALWTRGWNIFGITEAVAAGDGAPGESSTTGEVDNAGTCGLTGGKKERNISVDNNSTKAQLPTVIKAAQDFAKEKLWAMVDAHRAAGTPFGPVYKSSLDAKATKARFPLRRTLQDYETFANVQLDHLRKMRKEGAAH